MSDHRIRQLRAILWTVAAFAALWFWPHQRTYSFTLLFLAPVALFMPVFAAPVVVCARCTSATDNHTQVQVDIIGVVNKSSGAICTDCSFVNISAVTLTQLASPNGCIYRLITSTASGGNCWENVTIEFRRQLSVSNFVRFTSTQSPFPDSQHWDMTQTGNNQDCGITENSTGNSQVPGGNHGCDLSSSSVVITPL